MRVAPQLGASFDSGLYGLGGGNAVGHRRDDAWMLALSHFADGIDAGTTGLRRMHIGGNKAAGAALQIQAIGEFGPRFPTVKHQDHVIGLPIDRTSRRVGAIVADMNMYRRQAALKLMLRPDIARI